MDTLSLRRKAAIHESGHLLASFACRLPQVRAKGASIKADSTTAGRISWGVDTGKRALPADMVEEAAVVFLAGLAAEAHAIGGPPQPLEAHGAQGDLDATSRLLETHRITGKAADAMYERAWARARDLVKARWSHVEVIANALERDETLDEAAVESLRSGLELLAAAEAAADRKVYAAISGVIARQRAHAVVERTRGVPAAARRRSA